MIEEKKKKEEGGKEGRRRRKYLLNVSAGKARTSWITGVNNNQTTRSDSLQIAEPLSSRGRKG